MSEFSATISFTLDIRIFKCNLDPRYHYFQVTLIFNFKYNYYVYYLVIDFVINNTNFIARIVFQSIDDYRWLWRIMLDKSRKDIWKFCDKRRGLYLVKFSRKWTRTRLGSPPISLLERFSPSFPFRMMDVLQEER